MASTTSLPDGLDRTILSLLAQKDSINTSDLAVQLGVDHQLIIGAVKSLHSLGDVRHPDANVYTYSMKMTVLMVATGDKYRAAAV